MSSCGSIASISRPPRYFRSPSESGARADMAALTLCATSGCEQSQQNRSTHGRNLWSGPTEPVVPPGGSIGGHRFLRSVHNPWQPDRKGRSATNLALDRDIASHHLTEASAYGEGEAGARIFA